jgi:hypothetical protein
MNFSLILNSRKRTNHLINFLNSVEATTADKKSIEVVIRYDLDDPETESLSSKDFGIKTRFIKGPRPENLLTSVNEIAKISEGKNLFGCNDDLLILTKDWDQIALQKISKYLSENEIIDNIYYCKIDCDSVDKDVVAGYSSFPIISKKASDILGFYIYDVFRSLGGDYGIYRLYKDVQRVINLDEVKVSHILHNTLEKANSPDEVAAEYRQKFFNNPINASTFDISKEAKILKDYIYENSKYKFFE